MVNRATIGAIIGVSLAIAGFCVTLTADRDSAQKEPSIDAVLKAYAGGDVEAVSRTFTKSPDFVAGLRLGDPKFLERWLGDWNRTKAVLVIELANVAVSRAPQYMTAIMRAGRRYLIEAQADQKTSADVASIDVAWNRTAVGLLLRLGSPLLVEEHIDALLLAGIESKRPLDSRMMLARGIAKEAICWESRPTNDHPGPDLEALIDVAATDLRLDLDGPRRAVRRKRVEAHRACLRDAAARFEAAEAFEDTRAEAITRGGFALFLEGRAKEAAAKLATATPGDDRIVAYWSALFYGRALSALGRAEQSLASYERALYLYPGAQSASIGRTLELFHLRRIDEADAISQQVRATAAPDPWLTYFNADQRFVEQWLVGLRAVAR